MASSEPCTSAAIRQCALLRVQPTRQPAGGPTAHRCLPCCWVGHVCCRGLAGSVPGCRACTVEPACGTGGCHHGRLPPARWPSHCRGGQAGLHTDRWRDVRRHLCYARLVRCRGRVARQLCAARQVSAAVCNTSAVPEQKGRACKAAHTAALLLPGMCLEPSRHHSVMSTMSSRMRGCRLSSSGTAHAMLLTFQWLVQPLSRSCGGTCAPCRRRVASADAWQRQQRCAQQQEYTCITDSRLCVLATCCYSWQLSGAARLQQLYTWLAWPTPAVYLLVYLLYTHTVRNRSVPKPSRDPAVSAAGL